ncbi:hypothetical protein SH661x_001810 [Planctomicrobium sp. SH661]|uniref:hypothetical protein n=1 Tax=Planctomicrobium sp. SH661 TaxID=3448124 RepID=UPI003F5BDB7A
MRYLPLIAASVLAYFVPAAAVLMIVALAPILLDPAPLNGADWAPQYPPLPPRK